LSRRLGWEFVDLDRAIERKERRTIPEIFEEWGEERFREIENETLVETLNGADDVIVACGGGTVIDRGNRERLSDVATVFLEEEVEVLYERTRGSRRPLRAASPEEFEKRYEQRLGYYREVADLTIHMRRRPKDQVVEEIIAWLNG
jgi:shikimate kinase